MNAAPRGMPACHLSALMAGLAPVPTPDLAVLGVESDSRCVRAGDLFLAARGHAHHGLEFVDQAVARGASAIAWEPGAGISAPAGFAPALPVAGLGHHLGEIAARFFGEPSAELFCVGVTGTDGKTSCAHIIAQALAAAGTRSGYMGTLGYGFPGALRAASHTTPDPVTLQRWIAAIALAGGAALVAEASSHALDQGRTAGVAFDVAILTNIGRDHLDYHATPMAYAAAKRRLFDTPGLSAAAINGDDMTGRRWIDELSATTRVVGYGLGEPVAAHAANWVHGQALQLRPDGLSLTVVARGLRTRLETRLLGRFNAYNLLAAFSALLEKGLDPRSAAAALSGASTVPGRMEGFRRADGGPLVVVDYAHTPAALAGVLAALRAHCHGRLCCVFGCGGDRDRGKRPLMAGAVAAHADRLIITDDNPRSEDPRAIVDDMLAGLDAGAAYTIEHDRARAIRAAIDGAAADDVVLVAGKGHELEQIVAGERRPFSDRHFVAGCLGLEIGT